MSETASEDDRDYLVIVETLFLSVSYQWLERYQSMSKVDGKACSGLGGAKTTSQGQISSKTCNRCSC